MLLIHPDFRYWRSFLGMRFKWTAREWDGTKGLIPVPDHLVGVKGIYLNGCVNQLENCRTSAVAHAHNTTRERFSGYICVLKPKYFSYVETGGKVKIFNNLYLWHEYAHLLCPNQGHTEKWLDTYVKLHGHGVISKSPLWVVLQTNCCLYPLD